MYYDYTGPNTFRNCTKLNGYFPPAGLLSFSNALMYIVNLLDKSGCIFLLIYLTLDTEVMGSLYIRKVCAVSEP